MLAYVNKTGWLVILPLNEDSVLEFIVMGHEYVHPAKAIHIFISSSGKYLSPLYKINKSFSDMFVLSLDDNTTYRDWETDRKSVV